MDKQKLNKIYREMKENSIGLEKFLMSYYGISNNGLSELKMSHKDVKVLYPHIKRISFEQLMHNKEILYIGGVIPVKDSYGNIAPYLKPEIKDIEICTISGGESNNEEPDFDTLIIDEEMKLYELANLCRALKNRDIHSYRIAYKLLKTKKNEQKEEQRYKQKKLNLKMKGRWENDKY